MIILVTGGCGYIGSHAVLELLESGHDVVVVDNLSNSSRESLRRVERLTGITVPFYDVDMVDTPSLRNIFTGHDLDAVIHFAGLKAVGESVQHPLSYYRNNLDSTLSLLECMKERGVKKLVFSSSATVYGSAPVPYTEASPIGHDITSPYGQTKCMIERILMDQAAADPEFNVSSLRYFNPVGAHESGQIGEDPKGVPNNLMPFIAQVASGKRSELTIFGNDYDTSDGTCVRDYLHVMDLAEGHLAALEHITAGYTAYNLGSGTGTSVMELVNAFKDATGVNIPYVFAARRDGDLPAFYADPAKAERELGWHASSSIEQMCRDTWNWQSNNPSGYASDET